VKLQGVIALASLFGPPLVSVLFLLRAGLPFFRSLINGVYVFAACVLIFLGLVLYQRKFGMSDDELAFTLPVAVIVCLGLLMAPHFKRNSSADRNERPEDRDLG